MTEKTKLQGELMDIPSMVQCRDRVEQDGIVTWHEGFVSFPSLRAALRAIEQEGSNIIVDSILLRTGIGEFCLHEDDVKRLLRCAGTE